MLFRELNRGKCKTYLVACEATRRAALVDPLKDRVDRYLAILAYEGCRLDFVIDTHTLVYPAHDYRGHTHSTIGEEKRANPRLAGRSRADYVTLMGDLGLPLPDGIQEALQANQSAIEDGAIAFPLLAQLSAVRQVTAAA